MTSPAGVMTDDGPPEPEHPDRSIGRIHMEDQVKSLLSSRSRGTIATAKSQTGLFQLVRDCGAISLRIIIGVAKTISLWTIIFVYCYRGFMLFQDAP